MPDRQAHSPQLPVSCLPSPSCIAWEHLQPAERKALRATCRAGRLQHDGLLSELRLTLGCGGSPEEHSNGNERHEGKDEEPSPPQLRTRSMGRYPAAPGRSR